MLLLGAVTLACLLPFLGKPIHIDDPLFVWTARHLQSHPLDFYGFAVDWGLAPAPMSGQMQNPPLAAYYLALVGRLFGWSEEPAFWLPVAGAGVHSRNILSGTPLLCPSSGRRLGRGGCARLLAFGHQPDVRHDDDGAVGLVGLLVDGRIGTERKSAARLAAAALLIAGCSLTKYFGASLIPLLLVYTVWRERRAGYWIPFLGLPILVLAGYQWLTYRLYGQGLLVSAAVYASHLRIEGGLGVKVFEALAFTGGCILVPLAATPLLWKKKGLVATLMGAAAAALLVLAMKKVGITVVANRDTSSGCWSCNWRSLPVGDS